MREILFRGKRMDDGEWVEGYLVKAVGGECMILPVTTEHCGGAEFSEGYYCDPTTVGQYTGLNDKNGKQIFEGDIVKTSDITHEGVIQIKGESFEIAMRKGCWVMVAGEDWDFLETNHECIQVIGNIHGNQELQKGGEG